MYLTLSGSLGRAGIVRGQGGGRCLTELTHGFHYVHIICVCVYIYICITRFNIRSIELIVTCPLITPITPNVV
jgi:hypothetical protein